MNEPLNNPASRLSHPNDIVVFMVRRETKCAECGCELWNGNLLRMENNRPLCLEFADLAHLEFLGAGNTALTRILVTPAAIDRAEAECLADEERRARQRERAAERRVLEDRQYETAVAEKLRGMFPGCPADEAARIAAWTCRKHSGRVGRSAAAKEFDPQALRLAVVAHIRHEHTKYDELLMKYGDRQLARAEVRGEDRDDTCALGAEPHLNQAHSRRKLRTNSK